ncbi:MAG: M48 family metallopeptidase [Verrucomicrobiia bacterium]|jgi:heat shock protein HtpX
MWEQIRANRRRSAALITLMAVVLVLVGYTAGELIVGPGGGAIGLLIGLLIWGIQMMVYLTNSDSILLNQAYARELKRDDSPRLFNIVDEMRLASGLEFMPRIYLVDDAAPNAFAVGRNSETSAIAVTSGLMYRLNRDELQGVIAHEMSHLKNRDVQFMTLAAVMLGSIVILAEIVRRWTWYGGRGSRRSNERGGGQAQVIILLLGLVFAILGPLMAQLLYFACSRKREFLADACAAQYTRYPEGLASALERISQAAAASSHASKATAPMFIVNPLYAGGDEPDSVFSSHPSTAERIRVLRGMAGASLKDYEEAYRRAKGGGLIGTSSLGSAPQESIRAPSDEGPIETRHDAMNMIRRAHGYLPIQCSCGLKFSVPEGYEQDHIRCVRCGNLLPVPTAVAATEAPAAAPPLIAQVQPPLQYKRDGQGWASFRCSCGRTIQISPGFAAPFIRCANCGRQINVTS